MKKSEWFEGVSSSMSIWVAAFIFGLFFGASATDLGLSFFEIVFASATMFAGASQFVFLEVYGYRAPAWSIVLAVFAVNFRHVLYSASIGRHMGAFPGYRKYLAFFLLMDPLFADCEKRVQTKPITPGFYYGYGLFLYAGWVIASAIGSFFGTLIDDPAVIGLDLFLTIYFMTLLMGFRSKNNWAVITLISGAAAILFYHLAGPPWHISMGAITGIISAVLLAKPEEIERLKAEGGADV